MEPIFTDKQLNNMSREDLISLMKIVQEQTKKKDTEIQLLKDKQKELEFLNAMLSDRLTLAQRKQFGASSEKYAEGYEQMNLFNEAEANADAETEELFEEIRPSSYKCKKRKGKKEEDLHLNLHKHQLAVDKIQTFLDKYLKDNSGCIDYIHGEDVLKELSKEEQTIGIELPAMEKDQLFPSVMTDGTLPRKTFSMGHATEKRYYLEARQIR